MSTRPNIAIKSHIPIQNRGLVLISFEAPYFEEMCHHWHVLRLLKLLARIRAKIRMINKIYLD